MSLKAFEKWFDESGEDDHLYSYMLNSWQAALERHGITECDDPGEAIDMLVEGRDRQIADLQRRNAELEKAGLRVIGAHEAPHDCYATGPLTGNDYLDLVQCPSCHFLSLTSNHAVQS